MAAKTKKTAAKKGKLSRRATLRRPKPVDVTEVSGGGSLTNLLYALATGKGNAKGK